MKRLLFIVISLLLLVSVGWGSDPPTDVTDNFEVTLEQSEVGIVPQINQIAEIPEVFILFSIEIGDTYETLVNVLRPVIVTNMTLIPVNSCIIEFDGLLCHPRKAGDLSYNQTNSNLMAMSCTVKDNNEPVSGGGNPWLAKTA